MTKQVYKYPYNGRIEDEIKVFLSDHFSEKVVKITYRNGQIFCTIRDRITSKKKEIILSAAIIFGALFLMPTEARSIGVPVRLPSAPEINNNCVNRKCDLYGSLIRYLDTGILLHLHQILVGDYRVVCMTLRDWFVLGIAELNFMQVLQVNP